MSRKKQWNESAEMFAVSSGRKGATRMSSRQTVLAKSVRIVDEATRNDVLDAHLDKLEADNYIEDPGNNDDEEFVDEDDEDKAYRKKAPKARQGGSSKGGKADLGWRKLRLKSLNHILYEMSGEGVVPVGASVSSGSSVLSYLSIAAKPSKVPSRHFCSVCGYFACYTCTRCGMRLCRLKCQTHHRETRCLKFST